jgi:hypothetical protein
MSKETRKHSLTQYLNHPDDAKRFMCVSSSDLAPPIGTDFGPTRFSWLVCVEWWICWFVGSVGLGAGFDDVGVEGDTVDDGGD